MDLDELEELISQMIAEAKEDSKCSFDSIVELDRSLKRELYVASIVTGIGSVIDSCIRYWNDQDEKNRVPVNERQPIKIYINSQGGSLIETFAMIDAIRLSKTPVWTICVGAAYSGGFFTFIAGHKRFAYPTSSFLFHEGSTGNSADAGKFRNFAAFYDKQLGQLKDIVIKFTNITAEEYEKHQKDDWWFTAEEALQYGVCDEISERLI